MATIDLTPRGTAAHTRADVPVPESSSGSAVSWGAVVGGAVVAAAASLVLLMLGTGLGLASISPWANKGVQAGTFGVASIVWVIVTQLCASALGGYIAGRLRTRWTAVHTDEVYFRDTAHGLMSWAVATLVTASLVAFAALGAASTAAGTAGAAAGAAGATAGGGRMGYLVDSLFRRDAAPATTPVDAMAAAPDPNRLPVAEVTRIFADSAGASTLPPDDLRYLGQLVSQRTGLSQAEAERRVTNVKAAAMEAADKARKVGIQVSLWLFIALLAGAFIASYTATLGGRERDA